MNAAALAAGAVALVVETTAPDGGALARRLAEVMPPHSTAVILRAGDGARLAVVNPELAGTALPPGSVAKLWLALATAALHPAAAGEPVTCPGANAPEPGLEPCWLADGHGVLTLPRALAVSCNHYFAHVARAVVTRAEVSLALRAVGASRSANASAAGWMSDALGLTAASAAAPGEVARWTRWLAQAKAAGAGTAGQSRDWGAAARTVREGMELAVQGGTLRLLRDLPVRVAGKTGTAPLPGSWRTVGWFTGYLPVGDPRYVVTVAVLSGQGRFDATPVAHNVIARLLEAGP